MYQGERGSARVWRGDHLEGYNKVHLRDIAPRDSPSLKADGQLKPVALQVLQGVSFPVFIQSIFVDYPLCARHSTR